MKSPVFLLSILIYCALLSVSCNLLNPHKQDEPIKIRPTIQIIVDSIAKYNQLTSSGVGFSGVKTTQWERYEKLSKTASLPELEALTNHKNAVVRCYAFDALTARRDTNAFTILEVHLKDTARLSTFIGCIISDERVGDYFLDAVTLQDSTYTGYKLTATQKDVVDSIILFDKQIRLSAKYNLLYDLKPQINYYNRVKEIAMKEKMPVAIWALSKYKKRSDIDIIEKGINNPNTEDYSIRSVIQIPDSIFYTNLINIFEREWKEKLYDYQKWEILYQALAQYPSNPQTLALFKRTIQSKDKFRYQTLGTDLLIAITKYPNSAFEPLKKQIKLDEYDMEEVKQELAKDN